MTTTLNYLSGRLLISILFSNFSGIFSSIFIWDIIFFLLICLAICPCFYGLGGSSMLVLKKWSYVVNILWCPSAQYSQVTRPGTVEVSSVESDTHPSVVTEP